MYCTCTWHVTACLYLLKLAFSCVVLICLVSSRIVFEHCLKMFQFTSVPADYDDVYLRMARRGARVLALGYKQLGVLSHQQVGISWL